MIVGCVQIMRQRPTLRVVIASATMDVQKFALFFAANPNQQQQQQQQLPPPPLRGGSAPAGGGHSNSSSVPSRSPAILSVEGRLYPVQEHFLTVCGHNCWVLVTYLLGT